MDTTQTEWEAAIHTEVTKLGYDSTEVEAEAEGFGQDFAEFGDQDPVEFAQVLIATLYDTE